MAGVCTPAPDDGHKYLKVEQVRDKTHMSLHNLRDLTNTGKLPVVRTPSITGGVVRLFYREDVVEALLASTTKRGLHLYRHMQFARDAAIAPVPVADNAETALAPEPAPPGALAQRHSVFQHQVIGKPLDVPLAAANAPTVAPAPKQATKESYILYEVSPAGELRMVTSLTSPEDARVFAELDFGTRNRLVTDEASYVVFSRVATVACKRTVSVEMTLG